MKKQGCVTTTYTDNDCNNARKDWLWWALKKANCLVRFDKSGMFRFEKNGLVRFDKSVLFRFEKNGFFAFRKADLSL